MSYEPGTGSPMDTAPRYAVIMARGVPVRRGDKWPDVVRGEEGVYPVIYSAGIDDYDAHSSPGWRITTKSGGRLEAVEWWRMSDDQRTMLIAKIERIERALRLLLEQASDAKSRAYEA